MEKVYQCECGKTFDKPNSFNAHKSNCKVHFEVCGKDIGEVYARRAKSVSKTAKQNAVVRQQEKLNQWLSEQHTCERCGKIMTEKFGSGKFCSKSCANTRDHSEETKEKIRQGLTKQTICNCQFCNKEFYTLAARASHEQFCSENPDKRNSPNTNHLEKLSRFVVLYDHGKSKTNTKITLDITYAELLQYRQEHLVCEICGRSVTEATKWDSKFAVKNLCVDHDHATNKFRGLLCQYCNRQLGWYENNKENIKKYLDK